MSSPAAFRFVARFGSQGALNSCLGESGQTRPTRKRHARHRGHLGSFGSRQRFSKHTSERTYGTWISRSDPMCRSHAADDLFIFVCFNVFFSKSDRSSKSTPAAPRARSPPRHPQAPAHRGGAAELGTAAKGTVDRTALSIGLGKTRAPKQDTPKNLDPPTCRGCPGSPAERPDPCGVVERQDQVSVQRSVKRGFVLDRPLKVNSCSMGCPSTKRPWDPFGSGWERWASNLFEGMNSQRFLEIQPPEIPYFRRTSQMICFHDWICESFLEGEGCFHRRWQFFDLFSKPPNGFQLIDPSEDWDICKTGTSAFVLVIHHALDTFCFMGLLSGRSIDLALSLRASKKSLQNMV